MLFNSYEFILVYLPIAFFGFYAVARAGRVPAHVFLTIVSFWFYASWSLTYGILLVAQLLFNFVAGRAIAKAKANASGSDAARSITIVSVVANVALLGYFKYANFFLDTAGQLTGFDFGHLNIILPLAISFHTFQQISYLVDEYRGGAERYSFLEYCLFVLFFPQLIAGPIVRHADLITSIRRMPLVPHLRSIVEGLAFFCLGLAKKIIIADPLSGLADPVFEVAGSAPPDATSAWVALVAFGLGLYFDFSGYSDMAIGLSRLFGIRLPYNFASPYQSTSIIEFWRRWHITLSDWLRDYLYIPLGGSRRGRGRRYVNLFVTMLLGGLWHGASWNFVIWGGLHGGYLTVNHAWRSATKGTGLRMAPLLGWALTFVAVSLAWVFFRAADVSSASAMIRGLAGLNGAFSAEAAFLLGIPYGPGSAPIDLSPFAFSRYVYNYSAVALLIVGGFIVVALPNTQDIIDRAERRSWGLPARLLGLRSWSPTPLWGVGLALLVLFSMTRLSEVRQFVYFQF